MPHFLSCASVCGRAHAGSGHWGTSLRAAVQQNRWLLAAVAAAVAAALSVVVLLATVVAAADTQPVPVQWRDLLLCCVYVKTNSYVMV